MPTYSLTTDANGLKRVSPVPDGEVLLWLDQNTGVISEKITALLAAVASKAAQSALDALASAVSGKAAQSAVDALTSTVAGKAAQSALDSLASVVGGKADASAVTASLAAKASTAALASLESSLNAAVADRVLVSEFNGYVAQLESLSGSVDQKVSADDLAAAIAGISINALGGLARTGGTMQGSINMGGYNISNFGTFVVGNGKSILFEDASIGVVSHNATMTDVDGNSATFGQIVAAAKGQINAYDGDGNLTVYINSEGINLPSINSDTAGPLAIYAETTTFDGQVIAPIYMFVGGANLTSGGSTLAFTKSEGGSFELGLLNGVVVVTSQSESTTFAAGEFRVGGPDGPTLSTDGSSLLFNGVPVGGGGGGGSIDVPLLPEGSGGSPTPPSEGYRLFMRDLGSSLQLVAVNASGVAFSGPSLTAD